MKSKFQSQQYYSFSLNFGEDLGVLKGEG